MARPGEVVAVASIHVLGKFDPLLDRLDEVVLEDLLCGPGRSGNITVRKADRGADEAD